MRLEMTFESLNGDITLPVHYNFIIQSLIYKILSPIISTKLHNHGFKYEKRSFKLFTFSRILEKGIKNKINGREYLRFKNSISFIFSSPLEDIISDLGARSIKEREFSLLKNKIYLSKIRIITTPRIENNVKIKFLSPVTIHSTIRLPDGSKKCIYYKPIDNHFKTLIEKNLIKKFITLYKREPLNTEINIIPIYFSVKRNFHLIKFKDTPIEAFDGIFELNGSDELIKLSYETGLGDKNSEGFGLWEIWKGGKS
ncbi:MAG: CRISPR-associated endoribonuclease Cas6 [Spirochaetes bacterium]|nr:CRISPR-associated endoribonuclease Cas6 [Spirochaetota bacterium]